MVEQLGLPLIGSVAAGSPILAIENQLGRIQFDPNLFSPRADYLLKVHGNSMTGAGILDGDPLAVHKTSEARNGQIVVVRLEDEVTVKRLHKKGARIELIAENPGCAPIVVAGPLAIEGLAVGLNPQRERAVRRPCMALPASPSIAPNARRSTSRKDDPRIRRVPARAHSGCSKFPNRSGNAMAGRGATARCT